MPGERPMPEGMLHEVEAGEGQKKLLEFFGEHLDHFKEYRDELDPDLQSQMLRTPFSQNLSEEQRYAFYIVHRTADLEHFIRLLRMGDLNVEQKSQMKDYIGCYLHDAKVELKRGDEEEKEEAKKNIPRLEGLIQALD